VAFESQATDLANRDTNVSGLYKDIWVWDRQYSSITLVSRGSSVGGYYGGYGGVSEIPTISADGRYVAFTSNASNLVSGVDSTHMDIFVRDLVNNTTSLVSVGTGGTSGNGFSYYPVISPDGRYVVFDSDASDLVPGDNNNEMDVFVRDLKRKKTVLVSKNRSGEQGNLSSRAYGGGMSSDGRYVAFSSDANNLVDSDTNSVMDVFVASGFFPVVLPSTLLLLGD
jgi:Tol biopolymer transport system component